MVVVFYNKEKDKPTRAEMAKSKELFKNAIKNLILLRRLENMAFMLDELTSKFGLYKY